MCVCVCACACVCVCVCAFVLRVCAYTHTRDGMRSEYVTHARDTHKDTLELMERD